MKIIRGGADYFNALLKMVDNATDTIHLQTYIYDNDETGGAVTDALIRAAARKVRIFVLLDGYASQRLPEAVIERFRDAGIEFAFFSPMFRRSSFYLGRRLHHKVVVADGRECLVGGLNISNRYNDIGDRSAWLDWAVHVEGEVARPLHEVCKNLWNRSLLRKKCTTDLRASFTPPAEECPVRISRNDWVFKKTEITRRYLEMLNHAQSHVVILSSYFWPSARLLRGMERAAARGVQVQLILTGTADVPFAKNAERYLYNRLFRSNIEVFEYQRNILHGKIAVCDKQWLTVGSYNVNNISAYASVELNLDINSQQVAAGLANNIRHIINDDCIRVTRAGFAASNGLLSRFLQYCSYRFIHMVFFLFTFYFRQRK